MSKHSVTRFIATSPRFLYHLPPYAHVWPFCMMLSPLVMIVLHSFIKTYSIQYNKLYPIPHYTEKYDNEFATMVNRNSPAD